MSFIGILTTVLCAFIAFYARKVVKEAGKIAKEDEANKTLGLPTKTENEIKANGVMGCSSCFLFILCSAWTLAYLLYHAVQAVAR